FLIWLGVSSRSVADCTRRWKRFFTVSLSVSASWSSPMPRSSADFMVPYLRSNARPAVDEPAAERHLVGHAGQAVAGRRLGQAAHLVQDHARLDNRGPVFRLALALAHARLGRDGRDRLVGKDADVKPAFAANRVGRGDTARLDGLGAEPAALEGLQAEVAV